jgi:hypothetical protein
MNCTVKTPNNVSTLGGGDIGWSFPERVKVDDGQSASLSTFVPEAISDPLVVDNFDCAIPSAATIRGIVVEIKKAGPAQDSVVRLKKTSVIGQNKATANAWPNAEAFVSYGSDSDLWGTTWTPSEVNAQTFGVTFTAQVNQAWTAAAVNCIRVKIYWE